MPYAWHSKSRQTGQPFENQKLQQAELASTARMTTKNFYVTIN